MIGFLLAGLVIGALARLFTRGTRGLGLLATLVIGVLGSVAGGAIASLAGTGDMFELNVFGFVVAVISSVVLLGIARGLAPGGQPRGRRRLR